MIESLRYEFKSLFPSITRQNLQEGMLDSAKKAFTIGMIGIGAQTALNALMDGSVSLVMKYMPGSFLSFGMVVGACALFGTTLISKKSTDPNAILGYSGAAALGAGSSALLQLKAPSAIATILAASDASAIAGGLVAAAGVGLSAAAQAVAHAVERNQTLNLSERLQIPNSNQPQGAFDVEVLCSGSLVPGSLAFTAGTLFTAVGGSFGAIALAAFAVYQVAEIQKIPKKKFPSNDHEKTINALLYGSIKAAKAGAWIAAIGAVMTINAENTLRAATCAIVLGVTSHLQDR